MSTTVTGSQTFTIDAKHSEVGFTVRHMMISKVRGRFSTVSGSLTLPEGSNIPSAVDVEIEVSSIDTNEKQRDGHLTSPDFLHAEQHPKITFVSTLVRGNGPEFEIDGDLTIRGTSRPVTLKATLDGRTTDPWGMDRIAYSAETKIDREEFGMSFNQALETGGVLVGKEVAVELSIQAVRQP